MRFLTARRFVVPLTRGPLCRLDRFLGIGWTGHENGRFICGCIAFSGILHYPKAVMTRAGNCGFPPSPKSLSQRLHYLDSLRQSSLSNSGLREALGSTEGDVRRRAIGTQAPTYENAHFGCTSIPISDVLSPTSRVLSDSVATCVRHYVASLS